MIKLLSWNTAFRRQPWHELADMDIDVALLQETCTPPPEVLAKMEISPYTPWLGEHYSLTSLRPPRVVRTSDRVTVEWFEQVAPHRHAAGPRQMAVSGIGLSDAAIVTPLDGTEPFIVVSVYAGWQSPHPNVQPGWIYPDASAHRVISDLTAFVPTYIADEPRHRIIAAGDLNASFDGPFGLPNSFLLRARTIIDRMSALGLEYMGPTHPNGRKADPIPDHLDENSVEVPTYYTTANEPATAHVQIDHVFASRGLHRHVHTKAMNSVDEWGSSDHCRIIIDIDAYSRQ